jgi:hypothetical protein
MRIGWRGDKAEMGVESRRMVVFCMNGERTNASNVGSCERSHHCVLEQSCGDPLSLPAAINGEPCNHHQGYWMACETLGKPFAGIRVGNAPHYERVIADHLALLDRNIGS